MLHTHAYAHTDDRAFVPLRRKPLSDLFQRSIASATTLPSVLPQRLAVTVAEGLAAEDHEVTERAEGAQLFRAIQFWGRSATIYLSYKKMQAK